MLLISNAIYISLIEKALESLEAVNQGLELGMPIWPVTVDMTRRILGSTGDVCRWTDYSTI